MFRQFLGAMDLFWGACGVWVGGAAVVVVAVVQEEGVGWGVGWGVPWLWGVGMGGAMWLFVGRMLERERGLEGEGEGGW